MTVAMNGAACNFNCIQTRTNGSSFNSTTQSLRATPTTTTATTTASSNMPHRGTCSHTAENTIYICVSHFSDDILQITHTLKHIEVEALNTSDSCTEICVCMCVFIFIIKLLLTTSNYQSLSPKVENK